MFKSIALSLLLSVLTVAPAMAHEDKPQVMSIDAEVVGTYTSQPGESHDAFVLRVAQALSDWTVANHAEACGPIAKKADGTFIVMLTTQNAQTVCLTSINMPEGSVSTGANIHSHPSFPSGTARLSKQDIRVLTQMDDPIIRQMRDLNIRTVTVDVNQKDFSADDYSDGPGYLVVNGTLRYQHGQGTSVKVADLTPTVASATP